jgi:hypothetical protein
VLLPTVDSGLQPAAQGRQIYDCLDVLISSIKGNLQSSRKIGGFDSHYIKHADIKSMTVYSVLGITHQA